MSVATAPVSSSGSIGAAAGRLFRWNLTLAVLHAVQFVAILALSFAKSPIVGAPVVSSYLSFDPATRQLVEAQRSLFDLPIGPAVALFFLMSALAHATSPCRHVRGTSAAWRAVRTRRAGSNTPSRRA